MQSSLIEVIEEQAKIIELQSERIRKLSELLANYMTVEELDGMEMENRIAKLSSQEAIQINSAMDNQ